MRLNETEAVLAPYETDPVRIYGRDQWLTNDISSYRGYYDHLAIAYTDNIDHAASAEAIARQLRLAVGNTFTGYKGGKYRMHETTGIFVALYGSTGDILADIVCIDDEPVAVLTEDILY